jgi:imidazole glycerol-phosphate synthase subunit HisH
MIGIVAYGSGNVLAIANNLNAQGIENSVVDEPDELERYQKLILPGVGAFDETMRMLGESGFQESIAKCVLLKQVPILGICVGMQVMSKGSEEGELPGFGWIDTRVSRLPTGHIGKPKLPHMGWNSLIEEDYLAVLDGIDRKQGFYFLHSYAMAESTDADYAFSHYGERFVCAFQKGNIYGVQFHPEKSHLNGGLIFKNFSKI